MLRLGCNSTLSLASQALNELAASFPCLLGMLKLSLGSYQLAQAVCYINEHYVDNKFPLMVCAAESTLLQVKIQSRHKSAKEYNVFVRYVQNGTSANSIEGWYCSCPAGLRTVTCCVHVCSIILYLANVRYAARHFTPADKLSVLFKNGKPVLEDSESESDRDSEWLLKTVKVINCYILKIKFSVEKIIYVWRYQLVLSHAKIVPGVFEKKFLVQFVVLCNSFNI